MCVDIWTVQDLNHQNAAVGPRSGLSIESNGELWYTRRPRRIRTLNHLKQGNLLHSMYLGTLGYLPRCSHKAAPTTLEPWKSTETWINLVFYIMLIAFSLSL